MERDESWSSNSSGLSSAEDRRSVEKDRRVEGPGTWSEGALEGSESRSVDVEDFAEDEKGQTMLFKRKISVVARRCAPERRRFSRGYVHVLFCNLSVVI